MSNGQNSLSEDQVIRLMKHLEQRCSGYPNGVRDYTIVSFMLHAGLRVGEVVQLTVADVSLEGVVLESVALSGHITKSGKPRTVPMCKALRGSLSQHLKYSFPHRLLPDRFLFRGLKNEGVHFSVRAVQLFLEKASLECLGIHVHPHQLRHTFASRLMRITDMRTVQELLGHTSIKSTQVYTHPDQEDFKKAAAGLDELNKRL